MDRIEIFDSTLRDGAQGESINFSVQDKLNIVKLLDGFGVDYIEGGNPASNPKDLEFFEKASHLKLRHAKLVAFGSTRHKGCAVTADAQLQALAATKVDTVTVFGKSWELHVEEVLRTSASENLAMIDDTIRFLIASGKAVIFDAEHFFDGYKSNPAYALEVLRTAATAGAKLIALCDTNGGCFPDEISIIVDSAVRAVAVPIGIHCHNDTGCAVANSIAAVKAGAVQVQGTFIGIGERCGNANLSVIIPNLSLKLGATVGQPQMLHELTKTARAVAEIANIPLADNLPYVGRSAFSHKGGMHVDGVQKNPLSFEHINPESVGNKRSFLLSEVAGRSAIISRLAEIAPELDKDGVEVKAIIELLKEMEHKGYQYEAAGASFELLVKKYLGKLDSFFSIEYFKIIGEQYAESCAPSSAMVKVKVGEQTEISADEGDGPVNAIDKALRHALRVFYPVLDHTHLIDYKVRVMDSNTATAAVVRVLIETTDGSEVWTTVGASTDIINASVIALADSIIYKLQACVQAKL